MITRNFYISLLIFNSILFVGGWMLRESEAGVQAVVVAAFAIGLTLLHVLDDRDRRHRRSRRLKVKVASGRARNVSAAVEESPRAASRHQAMREAVALWEEEYGPISEEAQEWARKELQRAWR